MSNDDKGGASDLDIFEGLGKKTADKSAGAPPPPPGSSSHVSPRSMPIDARMTLLGIPGPAASSSKRSSSTSEAPPARTPGSRPPPPGAARPSGTHKAPSVPPPSPRPRPYSSAPSSGKARVAPAIAKTHNGKLDMDWDDAEETHVFKDKDREEVNAGVKAKAKANAEADAKPNAAEGATESGESLQGPGADQEPERASMDAILAEPRPSSHVPKTAPLGAMPAPLAAIPPPAPSPPPPPPPPAAPSPAVSASLSGAFGALGQPRDKTTSSPPSAKFRSGPPTSQAMRSAPPPPPASMRPPSSHAAAPPPPPPPPGQVTTAPMYMPPSERVSSIPPPPNARTLHSAQQPVSIPQPPHAMQPSHPSGHPSAHPSGIPSAPPVPHLPPVGRAMEHTMHTRPSTSKTPLVIGLLLGVAAVAAIAVFFLMPRSGTLVVNVADAKGGAVSGLEVMVDGTKRCDSAPCIVRDIPAGVHEVKVVAKGFDAPAPRAVTVNGRRDVPTDFQLVSAKASAGTGFKVAASGAGLKLQVDGKDVGTLPQEIRDLEPGEHKLKFSGDRYQPLEKTISVAKDEIIDLGSINAKVLKGKVTLQLGTPGAKVYLVNGTTRKEVPQFPMAIEFDPNEKWELQATKDGFDEYKERIAFDDGQAEKTFTITLVQKGTATAAAAPQAAHPTTPTPVVAAAAAPTVVSVMGAPAPKAAPKEAKESGDKEAASGGGETALKINSLPASSIVLDGKPIGTTPQLHVPVQPGTHTIMFVNAEQSLKKTISVDVKAGETKAAFAKLRE